MKNKVFELIKKGKVAQYNLNGIADVLNLHSTGDFVMLNKVLNELEDEFLIIRNHKNYYLLTSQGDVFKGIISVNSKGNGYLDLENYSVFIKKRNLNGALDKDEVIVKVNKRNRLEGVVDKVIKRNTDTLIGTLFFNRRNIKVRLDSEKYKYLKTDVINSRKFKIVDGLKAVFKIESFNTIENELKLRIEQIIGHKDDPGVDVLSILLQKDINPVFNEEAMKQANSIPQKVLAKQKLNRINLSKIKTVTIDGDDSKDFDDAISITKNNDGYELMVHIADVSYYVPFNSQLDLEARARGCSTYVIDYVVPMLPRVLSNGICSLNPKVERLTLTVKIMLDFNGDIKSYDLFPSVIKSDYRMTYNNVNKIFNGDELLIKKYHDIYQMLLYMKDCASVIREKREQNGAIEFDKDEPLILVDKDGIPVDIRKRERGESERIIEDFMICANEVVAKHLRYMNLPSLYRVHEPILNKKLTEFKRVVSLMGHPLKSKKIDLKPKEIQQYLNKIKDEEVYPVISNLMLRSMQKARYDGKCLGHFGLALDNYLHFTSPIRRYPDLVVHRMLKKYCFENRYDDLQKDELLMDDLAVETSNRERMSVEAEREVDDMKMAEYMSYHINEIYDGIISSVTRFGFFVELDNLIEGLVHIETLDDDYYVFEESTLSLRGERNKKRFILGQKVKVKVIKASKVLRNIDFVLVKDKKSKLKRWR